MKERIKQLCKQKGISMNTAETEMGLARGYISKLDKSNPNSKTLQKIADYFNVSINYLMTGENETVRKELSPKDERDIAKSVAEIMNKLDSQDGSPLFFDGEEITPETKILFEQQLKSLVITVKEINKVKYNPNKNKK